MSDHEDRIEELESEKDELASRTDELESRIDELETKLDDLDSKALTLGTLAWYLIGGFIGWVIVTLICKFFGWD